jgi:hypothetical protein
MTERRHGDDEVREIRSLAAAGDARDPSLPADVGRPTPAERQRIAQNAAIDPVRVARAAERLEVRASAATVRRSFGLPVGVSRVVDLPRAPTDREWERLIAEFRTTFGAQGRATTSGGLREWSHGHLHISVEPAADGERLRLSDLKDEAVAINGLGFLLVAMAVLLGAVLAAAGRPRTALEVLGVFGAMAVLAFFGAQLVRTPAWARERERQMEAIAERVVTLLSNS